MLRAAKYILLTLAVLAVGFGIELGVILYPYFRLPDEPEEVIQAKIAEYQKLVDEAAARPKEDREELTRIVEKLEPLFKDPEGKNEKHLLFTDPNKCPAYDLAKIKRLDPAFQALMVEDDRVRTLLSDGLTIQADYQYTTNGNTSVYVKLARWQSAAAVRETEAGRTGAAVERLRWRWRIADGLEQSFPMVFTLVGIVCAEMTDSTLIYLLPRFNTQEVENLADELNRLNSYTRTCVRSLKWELAGDFELQRQAFERGDFSGPVDLGFKTEPLFLLLSRITGFTHREFIVARNFRLRVIEAEEQWANLGKPWPPPDPITYEERSKTMMANSFDATYDKYLQKSYIADQRLAAFKAAIQAELKRRQTQDKRPIEIEFPGWADGPDGKIVIDDEKGCIILDKQEKAK